MVDLIEINTFFFIFHTKKKPWKSFLDDLECTFILIEQVTEVDVLNFNYTMKHYRIRKTILSIETPTQVLFLMYFKICLYR